MDAAEKNRVRLALQRYLYASGMTEEEFGRVSHVTGKTVRSFVNGANAHPATVRKIRAAIPNAEVSESIEDEIERVADLLRDVLAVLSSEEQRERLVSVRRRILGVD